MFTYNYHTHTTRCGPGHAIGTDREYIESAIKAGIGKLGFSGHSGAFFGRDGVNGAPVMRETAKEYLYTLRRLGEEYLNDITIYIGFEAEYDPVLFPHIQEACRSLRFDYILLGQHSLTTSSDGRYVGLPCDDTERLHRYVDEILAGLSTGSFTYLCHPDLFNFTGKEESYILEMTRLCRGTKKLDVPLELNLKGLLHNRHYPSDRFFDIAVREGNTFVIGFDAHDPTVFTHTSLREKANTFIEKHGITLLDDIVLKPI